MNISRMFVLIGAAGLAGLLYWRVAPTVHAPVTSPQAQNPSVPSTTSTMPIRPEPSGTKTQTLTLKNGRTLHLTVPSVYTISIAAEGYKHLRFMAKSPDNRLFVGEMTSADDTKTGHVYIFEDFDSASKSFKKVTPYLSNLRNPNSVAFYQDSSGKTWLYVAMTDRLVRYAYTTGDMAPPSAPEEVATFPDYGRPWSQGGWHLTRTIVTHNNKIYVSVGSSCNSCEEKANEPTRATILQMNPDGSDLVVYANGLRNAVGLQFLGDTLHATVNGPDHLGSDKPEDTFIAVKQGTNYGWPYCYQVKGKIYADTTQPWKNAIDCSTVPLAAYGFEPHSAPLGFDVFGNSFLVAIHGSGKKTLGVGYKIVSIDQQTFQMKDFMTGFLEDGDVLGRTAAILTNDSNSFFITDDYNGAIYYVSK